MPGVLGLYITQERKGATPWNACFDTYSYLQGLVHFLVILLIRNVSTYCCTGTPLSLKIKIRVLVILAIYHIIIHNHQEGSLEVPVNTKNHHLYGHHWRANYSQKILFLLEEHKELTVCCIITILLLDTLFDENRCLIQNKAKLMWVQTGVILMANILSLVDWSSLKWKF